MPQTKGTKMSVEDLYQKGSDAQANYDYSSAIEMYSRALGEKSIDPGLA
jgi:hypothetical protein